MSLAPSIPSTQLPAPMPGPRARFPGQLAIAFRRDTLGFLTRMSREYGDCVHFRAGRMPLYLFNHPDAVRDVLVTHDECFIKGPALQRAKETLGDGLLTSEGEFHRKQRR